MSQSKQKEQHCDMIRISSFSSTSKDKPSSFHSYSSQPKYHENNHIDPLITTKHPKNTPESILKQYNYWLSLAGFKTNNLRYHHYWIGTVFLYLLLTTCINGYLIPEHSICNFLALTVFSFQFESLVLYCFGYFILNSSFKEKFIKILSDPHLSRSGYCSKSSFRKELLYTTLIMSFSYISGALIFWEYDQKTNGRFYYASITNLFDVIRYLPQIVHIAVITVFYRAFLCQLEYLRNKYKIPSRKRIKNENEKREIQINFDEITSEMREILFPYNVMMSKRSLTLWISAYMVLNVMTIVLFWASILSPDCSQKIGGVSIINAYYIHYLAELIAYFVGWVFLVYPIYRCHAAFSSLVADIGECNVGNIEYNEYNAIMINLNGKVKHSPFSIGGWEVTLSRLLKVLLFVISTLIFDAVSNMGGFTFWNCD